VHIFSAAKPRCDAGPGVPGRCLAVARSFVNRGRFPCFNAALQPSYLSQQAAQPMTRDRRMESQRSHSSG